jgi:hypothetical protein
MNRSIRSKMPVSVDWGSERTARTPDTEERVLHHVDRDAGVSMRQMGEELNVSHVVIWKVSHEQLLYPYHLPVQVLTAADFRARGNFVIILFCEVLIIPLFHQYSLQTRNVSVQTP